METFVYVDVLLIINYIINLLLILCTTKFLGQKPTRRKIVAAAIIGSLCSLTIFLPFLGLILEILLKLAVSALIISIATSYKNIFTFIKNCFAFFVVSFFFAGVMLGIFTFITPAGMVYYNGIVYFDISSFLLIAAAVVAYLILRIASAVAGGGRLEGAIVRVDIYNNNSMQSLRGLIDTGNSLREPFSGDPVIVCYLGDIRSLITTEEYNLINSGLSMAENINIKSGFRLIPFASVAGKGVLPAFVPEQIILHTNGAKVKVSRCYLAVSKTKLGDNSYNAVLSNDIMLDYSDKKIFSKSHKSG